MIWAVHATERVTMATHQLCEDFSCFANFHVAATLIIILCHRHGGLILSGFEFEHRGTLSVSNFICCQDVFTCYTE